MFSTFDHYMSKPPYQAVAILIAGCILMLGGWLLAWSKIYAGDPLFAWSIACSFLLFYAMLSSLLSLRSDNSMQYWGQSVYSFIGLAFSSGLAAWLFSGIAIREAGSYRWLFFVITIGFLVFLSIVNMLKKIVQFAEREEWNQPKLRRRRRR